MLSAQPPQGRLGNVVWLSVQEEEETGFGKHVVVYVAGSVAASFTGCADPMVTSPPTNEHLSKFPMQNSYKEVVISFTQKRGLASNDLSLDK